MQKMLILFLLFIVSLFTYLCFENHQVNSKLKTMHYNKESIKYIKKLDLSDYVLKKGKYLKTFEQVLIEKNINLVT